MMGMQEACRGHIIECACITSVDQMHVIDEKLSSSSNKDVFIFSFEKKNLMDYILKIDEQRIYKFIVIINTPMNISEVRVGNWLIVSKYNSLIEIERTVAKHVTYHPSPRRFRFTAHEEYIWSLLKSGKTVYEIAHSLELSPETLCAERRAIVKKFCLQMQNEFLYLKFGPYIYND
ncbi:hypothetical protein [uncultured Cedecea sp.]|uniref:helix-turn-helix transcriptional regulator n=1 Tax=uncultured Cedecea sp. TaxID=988762 RepID=UPI00260C0D77|nr:hypothetical protein [uncultured Cedecea sp.]